MGFIRGSLFFFVSVLLIISLFLSGIFYMVSMSLDYDVVKANLVESSGTIIEEAGISGDVSSSFLLMQEVCAEMPSYEFNFGEDNFVVPCEVVNEGMDSVYAYIVDDFVMKDYYSDYDCSFLECFKETGTPNFLISEKTKDYADSKFYLFMLVSFILAGVLFLLIKKKSSFPIFIGAYLVVLSFPFLKLDSTLSFVDNKIILSFISIFAAKAYGVFAKYIFFGILFIAIGIIWKLFFVGARLNKFLNWIKGLKSKEAKAPKEKKSKNE